MAIKIGEKNVTIRVACAFDMSSNTELELHFKKPSGSNGTSFMVNSASGVALGTGVTDATLGAALAANTYLEYQTTGTGEFDIAGNWSVTAVFHDSATSPVTELEGDSATIQVVASNQVA